MSIATAITTAQGRVSNAYTAVSNKGGTLPATQNLSNLPAAIESIPSGGGQTVIAKAVVGTQSYGVDDKVILVPTGILYTDQIATASSTNVTGTTTDVSMFKGFGFLDHHSVVAPLFTYYYNTSPVPVVVAFCYWNDSYSGFSTVDLESSQPEIYNRYYNINYDGDQRIALKGTIEYYWNVHPIWYNAMGVLGANNSFVELWSLGDGYTGLNVDCVANFIKIRDRGGSNRVYWYDPDDTPHSYYSGYRNTVPSKYNGNWYFIDQSGVKPVTDTSTTAYSVSGYITYTDYWCNMFFDDNVDYFWEWSGDWLFRKINKTDTTWTVTSDTRIAGEYKSCSRTGTFTHDSFLIHSKDHGDTVESFVTSSDFGYDRQAGVGNKVAHFIFTKATETVERLPDVFPEIPDSYTNCGSLQVNWAAGLIGVTVKYKVGNTDYCRLYVKSLNDLAGIYKYYAYPNDRCYYYKESITGFVTDNQGVNPLGDTTLEVATVEDPNADPWTNIDIVFGMSIIVNEGVI